MQSRFQSSGAYLFLLLSACSAEPADAGDTLADGGSGGSVATAGAGTGGGTAGGGTTASGGSGTAGGTTAGGQSSAGTGGAPATAGTAGTGGSSLPVMPGDCEGLGEVGVWEEITPSATMFVADFEPDPVNLGTVYVGSGGDGPTRQGLFKSTDCGATWVHISTGMNGSVIDSGVQWTMRVSPLNPEIVYTNSGFGSGGLYKSTNGGVDWADITPQGDGSPGFAGNLQMDPENPDHLLLSFHNNCGVLEDGTGCIAESKDAGSSWKILYGTPKWPGQARPLLLHGDTWIVLGDSLLLTRDGGETFEGLLNESIGGHSSGTLSRMNNGDYYIGFTYGLILSPAASDGGEWTTLENTGTYAGDVVESDSTRYAGHGNVPFLTSPTTDGKVWTTLADSPTSEFTGYDSYHHILYSGGAGGKFWRMVTE